ncbi:YqgQ family protein [Virgibacillus soli]|uniref:YqgQ family protein n=1 Tax=Paracerasibacillus soli TaxID=480284 RepID=UPI0035EA72D7
MKTVYDVQQLLKRFGIFVYVGNRLADLELMELELREIFRLQMISNQQFQQASLILRSEINKLKELANDGKI